MTELKPCPFCGGEASVGFAHPDFMLKRLHNRYVFAGCKACGVVTPLFNANNKTRSPIFNNVHTEQAKQKAIEVWNNRVNIDIEDDDYEPITHFFRD